MPFRNKKPSEPPADPADELEEVEAKLQSEAERLEKFLREEPERKKRELEEERRRLEEESSYLAPLDELQDRQREKQFYEDLSRGGIKNRRRQLAGSLFVLILLVAALIATGFWVYGIYYPS